MGAASDVCVVLAITIGTDTPQTERLFIMSTPAITAAAHAVAAAEKHYDRAREGLVKTEAGRRHVAERIDALEVERSAIAARRRDGKGRAEDGGRLALIQVDLEDLAELLKIEDEKIAITMRPVNEAASAVQVAKQNLTHVEYEATEEALLANVTELDRLMLANLQELGGLHATLGRGKPAWCPSPALWQELRRSAAAANRL
jgi:hypothetical protein